LRLGLLFVSHGITQTDSLNSVRMTKEMVAPWSPRVVPMVAAGALLVLTGSATLWLAHVDRSRAIERAVTESRTAALRCADGVSGLLGELTMQTQAATTNPRLVAALAASVDQETLRDLLTTEPWWEPFRRTVDGYGLYADESTPTVTTHLPVGLDVRTAIREARQGHQTSSSLVVADGQLVAFCAAPIALAGQADWPVLVATRAFALDVRSKMAGLSGASIAVSDGRSLFIATGGSSVDSRSAIKQAMSRPTPGLETVGDWTVATLSIGAEVQLAVGVASVQSPTWGPLPLPALVILVIGIVLSLCTYALLIWQSRRSFPEEPSRDAGDDCRSAIDSDVPDGEVRPWKSAVPRSRR
jgi:hypothetical protein